MRVLLETGNSQSGHFPQFDQSLELPNSIRPQEYISRVVFHILQ